MKLRVRKWICHSEINVILAEKKLPVYGVGIGIVIGLAILFGDLVIAKTPILQVCTNVIYSSGSLL